MWLKHFPISFFATVMGVGGASLAWKRAAHVWHLPQWPSLVMLVFAGVAWVAVAGLWALKLLRERDAALADLAHPFKMPFAATVTIGVLLVATGLTGVADQAAAVLWWIGAVGHLIITVATLSAWLYRPTTRMSHVLPTWFIPVVGNLVAALAGPKVGSEQLAWLSFSVGLVMWLGLLPMVLQRLLVNEEPLPAKLSPTLTIMVAPPAVAMLAWQSLVPEQFGGPVSLVLGWAAIFFLVWVLSQAPRMVRMAFAMPWWAHSFPLAAVTTSTIALAGVHGGVFTVLGWFLLVLTTLVVLALVVRTLVAIGRREICLPE